MANETTKAEVEQISDDELLHTELDKLSGGTVPSLKEDQCQTTDDSGTGCGKV